MKRVIKNLVYGVAWLAVRPRLWVYALQRSVLDENTAFSRASEGVASIPGGWGLAVREAFYRATLRHVGQDVHIGYGTLFSKPQASLGDNVYLGRFCIVGNVTLERGCLIADQVQLLSGRHHHTVEMQGVESIHLGEGCWVGGGAVVMADVGENAVVGAGAVVIHHVREGSVSGGVPARMLRRDRRVAA